MSPPHLLSLADLTAKQIEFVILHANTLKKRWKPFLKPLPNQVPPGQSRPTRSLFNKSIALIFAKRSTRTRLAAETSVKLLGGQSIFLGNDDIHLGVNETLRDSAPVIGGMTQGIFARVYDHSDIEELAKYSPVPVINALSSLWHPTQTLADLLTIEQFRYSSIVPESAGEGPKRPLVISYVGDSTNVLHDMLVTYPRLGFKLRVATPQKYRAPEVVWNRVKELGCEDGIWWGENAEEAVQGADVVMTDTFISMGQEHEKEERLKDFQGYKVTEEMCRRGGANPNWKFMHCLPRKQDEVDDEVFYGNRSLVFPQAENRKWSILALFDLYYGRWSVPGSNADHFGRVSGQVTSHPADARPQGIAGEGKQKSS